MIYYKLRSAASYGFVTGTFQDEMCIIGLVAPYIIVLRFNALGSFVRVNHYILSTNTEFENSDMQIDFETIFRERVKRQIRRNRFREHPIEILRFRFDLTLEGMETIDNDSSCAIGIDSEPPYGLDVLISHAGVSHPDVLETAKQTIKWKKKGMYRFWWGNGYDLDRYGRCVSS